MSLREILTRLLISIGRSISQRQGYLYPHLPIADLHLHARQRAQIILAASGRRAIARKSTLMAGAMQFAVPAIPGDDTAHMGAGRRHRYPLRLRLAVFNIGHFVIMEDIAN